MASRNFITPGIILRSRPVGEKNRSLDILTPDRGLIRATAYGAASPRSKLRSAAQSYHAGELFLYEDPVKHYVKISDFDVHYEFPGIRLDPKKLYAASLISEIVLASGGATQGEPESYRLVFEFLDALSDSGGSAVTRLCALAMWRYLEILGIGPDLDTDVDSAFPLPADRSLFYRFDEGGFSLRSAGGEQAFIQPNEAQFLRSQHRRSLRDNAAVRLPDGGDRRLFSLSVRIIEYQFQLRLRTLEAGMLP
jgi:DNA repair protein RecO (recombination protein O)